MTFRPVQIPDSRWARFRGLARLPDARPVRGMIESVWIALTVRHGFRIFSLLHRLVT